jgi:hypothetical protein
MMPPNSDPNLGEKIGVRRCKVDSVDIFEVKEHELDLLEQGSPASLQLNFAIFLISIAFSSILTLTTAKVNFPIFQTVYVVVAVVGILLGGYLFVSWWRTKTSIKSIVATIKGRIPPTATICEPTATVPFPSQPGDESPAG